jgi:3-deoxy-7-phosphoheptulonate synthase
MEDLKLVFSKKSRVISVGSASFGQGLVLIAGPCSVESEEQIRKVAKGVKLAGAQILRAGAFKPRTSPYDFQGLGVEGLKILNSVRETLPVVSEVLDVRDLPLALDLIDIIQVGSRNMQNFPLLKELGEIRKPVILKRGMQATIEEWLSAAEYILSGGNEDVILCERGIRTFETYTRNTLDLNAVVAVKQKTTLPVIVDPSHGSGRSELVAKLCLASIGAGADGLMIEVHPEPSQSFSDPEQALSVEQFSQVAKECFRLKEFLG